MIISSHTKIKRELTIAQFRRDLFHCSSVFGVSLKKKKKFFCVILLFLFIYEKNKI